MIHAPNFWLTAGFFIKLIPIIAGMGTPVTKQEVKCTNQHSLPPNDSLTRNPKDEYIAVWILDYSVFFSSMPSKFDDLEKPLLNFQKNKR